MAWFRPWSPGFLPLTSATPHSSEYRPSISPASLCNWNEISSPASQQFFYSFLPQILSIILFDGTALLRTWRPINFLPLFISAAFTFLSCSSPASQGCFTSPHFLWSTSGISPEACAVSFCGELKWSVLLTKPCSFGFFAYWVIWPSYSRRTSKSQFGLSGHFYEASL